MRKDAIVKLSLPTKETLSIAVTDKAKYAIQEE